MKEYTKKYIYLVLGCVLIYIAGAWGCYVDFVLDLNWMWSYSDYIIFIIGLVFIFKSQNKETTAK